MAVERLARLLGYAFDFVQASPNSISVLDFPVTKLMAVLIVVTKLLSPFDSIDRQPATADELGCASVDWTVWNKRFPRTLGPGQLDDAMDDLQPERMTTDDAMNTDPAALDNYMDWFEKTFADDYIDENARDAPFRRAIFEMFPLQGRTPDVPVETNTTMSVEASTVLERVRAVQSNLKINSPVLGDEEQKEPVIRPGTMYRYYRTKADVPKIAECFFETAARLVAVSVGGLLTAVYKLEMLLKSEVKTLPRPVEEDIDIV